MSEYFVNVERRTIIVIFFDLIETRWYFENLLSNVILILSNEIIIRRIDGNETLERMQRQIKGLCLSCDKITLNLETTIY